MSSLLTPHGLRSLDADEPECIGHYTGNSQHRAQACLGSISTIIDGDPPHAPQGAIAQAWSVAELIRHWSNL